VQSRRVTVNQTINKKPSFSFEDQTTIFSKSGITGIEIGGISGIKKLNLFDLIIKQAVSTAEHYLFQVAPSLPSVPTPVSWTDGVSIPTAVGSTAVTIVSADVVSADDTKITIEKDGAGQVAVQSGHQIATTVGNVGSHVVRYFGKSSSWVGDVSQTAVSKTYVLAVDTTQPVITCPNGSQLQAGSATDFEITGVATGTISSSLSAIFTVVDPESSVTTSWEASTVNGSTYNSVMSESIILAISLPNMGDAILVRVTATSAGGTNSKTVKIEAGPQLLFSDTTAANPGSRVFTSALPSASSFTLLWDEFRKQSTFHGEALVNLGVSGGMAQGYWKSANSNSYAFFYGNQLTQRYATADGETIMSVSSSHPQNTWMRYWVKVVVTGTGSGGTFKIGRGQISGTSLTQEWETSNHSLDGDTMSSTVSIGTQHYGTVGGNLYDWGYPGGYNGSTANGTYVRSVKVYSGVLTNSEIGAIAISTGTP